MGQQNVQAEEVYLNMYQMLSMEKLRRVQNCVNVVSSIWNRVHKSRKYLYQFRNPCYRSSTALCADKRHEEDSVSKR